MNNSNATYEWLEFLDLQKKSKKAALKEEKISDFVSGRNVALSRDVGAYDIQFYSKNGDFIQLDPNWISNNIVSVQLVNGGKILFHKKYAGLLKTAFEKSCRSTGWSPQNTSAGYCPQPNGGFVMRRSRAPSDSRKPVAQREIGGHAWGTSIDLGTASENPMGGGGRIRSFPTFIETMKRNGFIWGGDFKSKDDMHFEVNIDNPNTDSTDDTQQPEKNTNIDYIGQIGKSISAIKSFLTENDGVRLTDEQVAKLLFDVGFRDEDLVTAVRIVLGESGGNPNAVNVNVGGSRDRGIFQFNDKAFPNFSDEDAFNPIKSAKYAFDVYKRVGFKPWRGKTKFHTLKQDGTPDTDRINRASAAVEKISGYESTGDFEYLGNTSNDTVSSKNIDFIGQIGSSLNTIQNSLQEGKDKRYFLIKDKTKKKIYKKYKNLFDSLVNTIKKKLDLTKPVIINLIEDEKNQNNPLGNTGGYMYETNEITVYVSGRHIKDILRSIAHELVHHKQNLRGDFDDETEINDGYAQRNKFLRKLEKEAYLYGNILFRDWEDNYKSKSRGTKNEQKN